MNIERWMKKLKMANSGSQIISFINSCIIKHWQLFNWLIRIS